MATDHDNTTSPEEPSAADGTTPHAPRGWAPSRRLTAGLAAAMLAVGVGVGAAIGPAPDASLAGVSRLPLLSALIASANSAGSGTQTQAPPVAETATPRKRFKRHHVKAAATETETENETETNEKEGNEKTTKTKALPPIAKVWLIELAGGGFSEATSAPASAPFITGQAIPAGALAGKWSGLEAAGFASDAALLSSAPPQALDTIVQPPCPEATAAACSIGTPGAVAAADAFLKATLPTITSLAAYRESGLIVVTFGSIVVGTATGLPEGAATATLTAEPPAGALLISPFVKKGTKPTTTFNPASPTQSLGRLLHK